MSEGASFLRRDIFVAGDAAQPPVNLGIDLFADRVNRAVAQEKMAQLGMKAAKWRQGLSMQGTFHCTPGSSTPKDGPGH